VSHPAPMQVAFQIGGDGRWKVGLVNPQSRARSAFRDDTLTEKNGR
jgi:hypothetical protein